MNDSTVSPRSPASSQSNSKKQPPVPIKSHARPRLYLERSSSLSPQPKTPTARDPPSHHVSVPQKTNTSSYSTPIDMDHPSDASEGVVASPISEQLHNSILSSQDCFSHRRSLQRDSPATTQARSSTLGSLKTSSSQHGTFISASETLNTCSADSVSSFESEFSNQSDETHIPFQRRSAESDKLLPPSLPFEGHAIRPLPNGLVTMSSTTDVSCSIDNDQSLQTTEDVELRGEDQRSILARFPQERNSVLDFSDADEQSKVGGFGVRADLIPHVDGMLSSATERALKYERLRERTQSELGGRAPVFSANVLHRASEATLKHISGTHRRGLSEAESQTWGANFWCVITDPASGNSFFANPQTGECRWEVPTGTIVLPPNPEGEWWELFDGERNLPYFYHTQTATSVWERPQGLVIPLVAIQESVLGRRFETLELGSDKTASRMPSSDRRSSEVPHKDPEDKSQDPHTPTSKRSIRFSDAQHLHPRNDLSLEQILAGRARRSIIARDRKLLAQALASSPLRHTLSTKYCSLSTSKSADPSPAVGVEGCEQEGPSNPSMHLAGSRRLASNASPAQPGETSSSRTRSLRKHAAAASLRLRKRSLTVSGKLFGRDDEAPPVPALPSQYLASLSSSSLDLRNSFRRERDPTRRRANLIHPPSSSARSPSRRSNRIMPISIKRMSTGDHQCMPLELQSDIKLSVFESFAARKFSTHRYGPLRRKVGLETMMSWQKAAIGAPLLQLQFRELQRDAIKIFKIIQRIMGDRETPVLSRASTLLQAPLSSNSGMLDAQSPEFSKVSSMSIHGSSSGSSHGSLATLLGVPCSGSSSSPPPQSKSLSIIEEERWVLGRGVASHALRDEIYVQVMKQLSHNPSRTSVFRGWQFLCVLVTVFRPSKDLTSYLSCFLEQHTSLNVDHKPETDASFSTDSSDAKIGGTTLSSSSSHHSDGERAVDGSIHIMAAHCLSRLKVILQRGGRSSVPSVGEIQAAMDAAFNPCVFSRTLDEVMVVQKTAHADTKVPLVLIFLCGILLDLNGTTTEGVFRLNSNQDLLVELKNRIDRGHLSLEGMCQVSKRLPGGLRERCRTLTAETRPVLDEAVPKQESLLQRSNTASKDQNRDPLLDPSVIDRRRAAGEAVHLVASTLKLFLRELTTPLIPIEFYDVCLQASLSSSKAISVLVRLPLIHRRVLVYLLTFLQVFLSPKGRKRNRLTVETLALVFAPIMFQSNVNKLSLVFNNSRYEQQFLITLLRVDWKLKYKDIGLEQDDLPCWKPTA